MYNIKIRISSMQNKTLLYIGLITVGLIGASIIFLNRSKSPVTQQSEPLSVTISTPSPAPQIIKLSIIGSKATPEIINVQEGETVRIEVTSDMEDELHIHGLDKEILLKKNQPASIEFVADQTGRFIMELHESEKEIGAIEVSPK